MKISVIVIGVVLAVSQLAAAQDASNRVFDGKALADAIHDFASELRSNIQRDVAIWRERSQKMRQEFRDRINKDEDSRRRLLTTGAIDLTKDLTGKGWELIFDAGGALKNVIEAKKVRVHEFFSDALGGNWASFVPTNWLSDAFSWDSLGMFDFESNLQDFMSLDAIRNFEMPQNYGEMVTMVEDITSHFCEHETYSAIDSVLGRKPEKVPTRCYGPNVTITYEPKTCTIDSLNKQIICDPAKLVLHKVPAQCTLKHLPAFVYTGKFCRHAVQIGKPKNKTIGGQEKYDIDISEFVANKLDAIKDHVKPDAPLAVTTEAVLGKPTQRRVMFSPPEKASAQGIFKYNVACVTVPEVAEATKIAKIVHPKREIIVENLVAGATYTCSVAAVNLAGIGPATTSAPFTVPIA